MMKTMFGLRWTGGRGPGAGAADTRGRMLRNPAKPARKSLEESVMRLRPMPRLQFPNLSERNGVAKRLIEVEWRPGGFRTRTARLSELSEWALATWNQTR